MFFIVSGGASFENCNQTFDDVNLTVLNPLATRLWVVNEDGEAVVTSHFFFTAASQHRAVKRVIMRWRIDDRSRCTLSATLESLQRAMISFMIEVTIPCDFSKSFCSTTARELVITLIWSPTIGVKFLRFESSVWNKLRSPVKTCLVVSLRNSCAWSPCSGEWTALKRPSSQLMKTSPRCPSSYTCVFGYLESKRRRFKLLDHLVNYYCHGSLESLIRLSLICRVCMANRLCRKATDWPDVNCIIAAVKSK